MRLAGVLEALGKVKQGAIDTYGESREDKRLAFRRAREDSDKEKEATRLSTSLGTNRTVTAVRELLGIGDPKLKDVHRQMGMALSDDRAYRTGQLLGIIGNDLTQDTSRELWWLLNAPQAVGNVAAETAIMKANPKLYNEMIPLNDSAGNRLSMSNKLEAEEVGALDPESGRLKKGYSYQEDEDGNKLISKRAYEPGHVAALGIPTGLAINTAIGLMNPFGGAEGYKAAIPDEEDPTKTKNVVGEVAAKYILGRTGNLLPWEEFKQVRPDVSKDEYMKYKAFKFDKDEDYNPFDDGQMSALMGAARYTNEGIHGPEVQFLGRSLPIATGIMPTAAAIAGTALGARSKRNPIGRGFSGGMAGAVGGMGLGMAIEDERRRRNQEENERDNYIDTIN